MRGLEFVGRSKQDLSQFPASARAEAGHALYLLQEGRKPKDWKPMKSVGLGVNEIRIHDEVGAFRVIYIAKFEEAIFVLHCFEKKSQKTSAADLAIASARYRIVLVTRRSRDSRSI
jgi:phage-related protein